MKIIYEINRTEDGIYDFLRVYDEGIHIKKPKTAGINGLLGILGFVNYYEGASRFNRIERVELTKATKNKPGIIQFYLCGQAFTIKANLLNVSKRTDAYHFGYNDNKTAELIKNYVLANKNTL